MLAKLYKIRYNSVMKDITYFKQFVSPIGVINLESDGEFLTGLYFNNGKYKGTKEGTAIKDDLPIFNETEKWLMLYFGGEVPTFTPKYKLINISAFGSVVINILTKIPYGKLVTYGDIAKEIEKITGKTKMSAQAVGGAVGRNPICIIIPCHRVVGKNHNLVGFTGGMDNKINLLKIEGVDLSTYKLPKSKIQTNQ